ncbi:hypothetical protein K1T71_003321 [Dendrolimus kikuchii]|uniref:Uncharacterized protein n=1 Tax=Dendrolimus kikuchii TaxID=765133 RepID=A0ACC1DBQ0_9NEOP|nr:hypothetical protein K1T71_003321 [Dendrolimus kikuchii]
MESHMPPSPRERQAPPGPRPRQAPPLPRRSTAQAPPPPRERQTPPPPRERQAPPPPREKQLPQILTRQIPRSVIQDGPKSVEKRSVVIHDVFGESIVFEDCPSGQQMDITGTCREVWYEDYSN